MERFCTETQLSRACGFLLRCPGNEVVITDRPTQAAQFPVAERAHKQDNPQKCTVIPIRIIKVINRDHNNSKIFSFLMSIPSFIIEVSFAN